jgi:Flp pilus assembly protein CpaB
MRLTRQAALAIALIAGLLAALLAWVLIGQGGGKPKPKVQEMIQIPVPINTIAAGTELQAGMFEVTEQAKELLPTNVVADAQAMAGYIAVLELPEGQPVRVEQVQERSAKLGMAYALNPGLRGMAVSLDVIGAVGDFIKPLDHVDVLTSFRREDKVVVRTLIQDVVVLALGQTIVAETPAATSEGTSETKAAPAAKDGDAGDAGSDPGPGPDHLDCRSGGGSAAHPAGQERLLNRPAAHQQQLVHGGCHTHGAGRRWSGRALRLRGRTPARGGGGADCRRSPGDR